MATNKNPDYEQVKHLLTNTVTLLCKNGVPFTQKLHVEALVGVTVDQNDVFFVHISETIPHNEQPWEKSAASHGQYGQSDYRSTKMQPQVAKVQKNSVQDRSSPRTQSPVSHSPRSGSPAVGRQPRNGTMMQQQQQQQHRQNMLQQQQFQHHQRMQQQQQQQQQQQRSLPHSDFAVSKPSPQQKVRTDDEDVVLIKQERLASPNTVAQQATMVAGRRRAMPTPPPAKVTVIEPVPDPSQDDTQAMQQSYSTSHENLNHTVPTGLVSEPEEPPTKRPCIEMSSGSSSTSFIENSPGRHFSGQWGVADSPIPPHPVTYSEASGRSIQAFPGCSTWPSHPTPPQLNASTEAAIIAQNTSTRGFKNPRNNTMCQPVRDVLEFSLARPVLAEANEVSAFRLFWRGHDTIAGWRNIIYNRLELDAIVAEDPGVSFFISAITATARDPKTLSPNPTDARLRAYPALGYWIVSRDASFDRHLLMKRLSEAAEGGELKTMLQSDGEKVNEVGALNLIVKDYGKGYVQQRVMESAVLCCNPDEEHPTIRFILKEDHFEEKLREAVDLLSGVGCPVSLEKVDMEAANGEDDIDGEGEEEGGVDGEVNNGYDGKEGDEGTMEGEKEIEEEEEQAAQGIEEEEEEHVIRIKKPPPDDEEEEEAEEEEEGSLQLPVHTEDEPFEPEPQEERSGQDSGSGEPMDEGFRVENVPPDLEGNAMSQGQGDGPGE